MHRIDTEGHQKNRFFDGDSTPPFIKPATVIDASWLNGIQESLATVVEKADLKLEKGKHDRLLRAIEKLIDKRTQKIWDTALAAYWEAFCAGKDSCPLPNNHGVETKKPNGGA